LSAGNADIACAMQASITLGDALNYPTSVPDYPATDGWELLTRLVPRPGFAGSAISISAVADSDDPSLYRTSVGADVTAAWTAGQYSYECFVRKTSTGERYSVDRGQITLAPDPLTATELDNRSAAEAALDAVTAALMGRATSVQKSYRIGEREVQFYEATELVSLRSQLVTQVKRERAATAMAKGLANPQRYAVRMSNA
jgi:hypothetical protein